MFYKKEEKDSFFLQTPLILAVGWKQLSLFLQKLLDPEEAA